MGEPDSPAVVVVWRGARGLEEASQEHRECRAWLRSSSGLFLSWVTLGNLLNLSEFFVFSYVKPGGDHSPEGPLGGLNYVINAGRLLFSLQPRVSHVSPAPYWPTVPWP